eukprot:TRINITY_DN469_c0_g1_i3.p1 TRINITY_DN469_c0_g1~~TRINITY_DN469_c0_g1_i3.p1  ORF type:complete len:383 (-),score=63.81 TRINITY_DN469_c0_g1_i3:67-1215(-)
MLARNVGPHGHFGASSSSSSGSNDKLTSSSSRPTPISTSSTATSTTTTVIGTTSRRRCSFQPRLKHVCCFLLLIALIVFLVFVYRGRFVTENCPWKPYTITRKPVVVEPVKFGEKGRPTIVFVHMDKSGGLTFDSYLRAVSKRKKLRVGHASKGGRAEVVRRLKEGERFDLIYGGFGFDVCQYSKHPCTYMVLLRDPIDRIISDYNYFCVLGRERRRFWRFGWTHCQTDLIDWATYDRNNVLTMHLAHDLVEKEKPGGYCNGKKFVNAAKANLEGHFSAILLLQDFDEGLEVLRETYGTVFEVPTNLPHKNKHDNKLLTRDQLTRGDLSHLKQVISSDVEVYEYAKLLYLRQPAVGRVRRAKLQSQVGTHVMSDSVAHNIAG